MRKLLTPEYENYILKNYKNKTPTEISIELNFSRTIIRNFLNRKKLYEYKKVKKTITCHEMKFILNNYKKITIREISEKLNRPEGGIFSFLRKMGISKRLS